MSNTLLSPLPSLCLSDDDIPPATATLCRWHPQPRPTAAKTQILQHAGTGLTARTPTKLTDPAIHSSRQFRPRAAKSRRTSPEIPIDRHCRRRILPRGFLLRGFSDACLHAAPRAVTGRHPKTLNERGHLHTRDQTRGVDRFRTFPPPPRNGEVRPNSVIGHSYRKPHTHPFRGRDRVLEVWVRCFSQIIVSSNHCGISIGTVEAP